MACTCDMSIRLLSVLSVLSVGMVEVPLFRASELHNTYIKILRIEPVTDIPTVMASSVRSARQPDRLATRQYRQYPKPFSKQMLDCRYESTDSTDSHGSSNEPAFYKFFCNRPEFLHGALACGPSLPVITKTRAIMPPMQCRRAIIGYKDGKPASYCLILPGTDDRRGKIPGAVERETTFKEAYDLFPAIRKHWKADGTAKE